MARFRLSAERSIVTRFPRPRNPLSHVRKPRQGAISNAVWRGRSDRQATLFFATSGT